MSESLEQSLSLEAAWENLSRVDFSAHFIGNTVLVGYGEDTTTFQVVCMLLARPEAPPDSFERNRQLVTTVDERNKQQYIATKPVSSSGVDFKPYTTMTSFTDGVSRDLHVVTTGKRAVAIGKSMSAMPGRRFPEGFGRGEASNYEPVSEDPTQTPVVSGLLNIGWRKVKNNAGQSERIEKSANYGLVTQPRYVEATELPFLSHIIPGTARAAHSFDPVEGEPKLFTDSPVLWPLFDKPKDTLRYYWEEVLPEEQKVAMAVLSVRGLERVYHTRNAADM